MAETRDRQPISEELWAKLAAQIERNCREKGHIVDWNTFRPWCFSSDKICVRCRRCGNRWTKQRLENGEIVWYNSGLGSQYPFDRLMDHIDSLIQQCLIASREEAFLDPSLLPK